MDITEFKNALFNKAKESGFEEYELYYSEATNSSVTVYKSQMEKYSESQSSGIGFRGIFNGSMGYYYSELVDVAVIDDIIKGTIENAGLVSSVEREFIFSGIKEYSEVNIYNPKLSELSVDMMTKYALEAEKAALEYDKRITSVNKSVVGISYSEKYIANSKGVELCERNNSLVAFVVVIAKQENSVKEKCDIWFGRDYSKLNPTELGVNAAKKAVNALNGQSMPSGDYRVILKNTVMAEILGCFASNFYGDKVNKGFSLLKGKINQAIVSDMITIVDEPLLEDGLATTAFDSEGVACYNKTVVENGVLKTFLHNMRSANTAGVNSTGNGFKGSFKGTVNVSPSNFYIKNGATSYDDLLNMGAMVIITDVAGLHSGANVVSGDFSLAAEGFYIRDGEICEAVEQITVSGNFYSLLNNVIAVADDLELDSSAIGSPSVLFDNIHISGDNK